MNRLLETRGFALAELLVVLMISMILLSSTLLVFERMVTGSNESDRRQDSVELARRTLDNEARQLRNLAKRLNNAMVIATTQPYDFVFQTSDPARTWVRYCLNNSNGLDKGRLYEQLQSLAVGAGGGPVDGSMTSSCPSSNGWTKTNVVATNITNKIGNRDRPMFFYRCADGTSTAKANATCTATTTVDRLIGVEAHLFVNTTPKKMQEEIKVNSSVFLRNQNQAPVARANASASGPRTVVLNASASTDYENRTLQFFWFLNTMPTNIQCNTASETNIQSGNLWGGNLIGRGISFTYKWPGTTPASGTPQTFGLVACDPGDRFDTLDTNLTVNIP
jgi:type II secretory pathway pseudopilin PulG